MQDFIRLEKPNNASDGPLAVSLFSGAGISDFGYLMAGYRFRVQVEKDPRRANIGRVNFPGSEWLTGDVRELHEEIVRAFNVRSQGRPLELLVATPPCQGMSSSNSSRGKRRSETARIHEQKNRLALEAARLCRSLQPFVLVMENVRQIRTLHVSTPEGDRLLLDVIKETIGENYAIWDTSLNVADYGVPQNRYRAVIVAVRKDIFCVGMRAEELRVWPAPTHGPTLSRPRMNVGKWFRLMKYRALDSSSKDTARSSDPLHFVPCYTPNRYRLIADIAPNSGASAYQTDLCPHCAAVGQLSDSAICRACGGVLFNRPVVETETGPRLIKGFKSSYRRMLPSEPAPTITTASGHIGSDTKIHPWENRLLSLRESAELQTVPRTYDWSFALHPPKKRPLMNVIRDVVGEAFPPYFTYLHGRFLLTLLRARLRAVNHPGGNG